MFYFGFLESVMVCFQTLSYSGKINMGRLTVKHV